jgi:hypothetical protein
MSELLPLGFRVGQDAGQEPIGAQEGFGLALELDLPVLTRTVSTYMVWRRGSS